MISRFNGTNVYTDCLWCKKYFEIFRNSQGKYCSNQCQKDYEFEIKYKLWLNGKIGVWKDNRGLKRAVTRKNGYSCTDCGIEKWNGKEIILELEHKDGNSSNNLFDNLCLICPNCHSQTSTFKNKNMGKGRYFRRQRYAEGKSY